MPVLPNFKYLEVATSKGTRGQPGYICVLSHASDEGKVRQDTKWQGASTRDLFRIGESVNLVFWIGGRFTVSRDDAGRV